MHLCILLMVSGSVPWFGKQCLNMVFFLLHVLYTIGHVVVVGRFPHCLENFTNMNKSK